MTLWEVYTPQFTVWDGGMMAMEPPEYGCEWAMVEADSAREAKVKAVREWRAAGSKWIEDARSDNASPFTGLIAEAVQYGPTPDELDPLFGESGEPKETER